MSKLHFIGGEKGGVGKSLVSRLLAQYMIDHHLPFIGFDTDKSHGALLRFYADYASPVIIDRYESLDRIVDAAMEQPDRRILVDLAAQTHQFLVRWIEDSGLLDLREDLGMSIVYWHVMDSGRDSVDLLRALLGQFGGRMQLVLVLNEVRGDRFDILDASGLKTRAEDLGVRVIGLRHLQDTTIQKIDAHNTSFWAAVNLPDPSGNGLGLMERQRVKIWMSRTYKAFGQVQV
ncbi:putative mobilization protein MobD [Thiomonas sp. X19]|uniref:mobilization protein n=1 Tax=Thiomonas sp. X19 TaxID=1050370 RepID=UPI000B715D21|nr:mobilization protein [Thiomonas sp. X19]SCC94466.1 putative mobilization protein MobD [Thiomonas sp. X19]